MTSILICARGGSKGIHKKNLSRLGPWSLLEWSIHMALLYTSREKIFLSSDSLEILSLGQSYGINCIKRPDSLATDSSPEEETWKHFIENYIEAKDLNDPLVILPPTSPFRNLKLLDESIACLSHDTPLVVSAYPSARSPWFNMVKNVGNNHFEIVIPNSGFTRRQDAPPTFDLSTCFFTFIPSLLMSTKSSRYELPFTIVQVDREQTLDIDEPCDLELARMYWNSLGAEYIPSSRTDITHNLSQIESMISADQRKSTLYSANNSAFYRKALLYLMGYLPQD